MSKGVPRILQLETLNKVISKMPRPSNLFFTNMFRNVPYDSDTIRWILEYGTAGMTPFVAPGAPSPAVGDEGMWSEGSAVAAYWKEKTFLDEVILNNLREPLTASSYYTAERQIARKQMRLRNRCDRRKEWMMAKSLFDGQMTYRRQGGLTFTVNYGIPANNVQTLAGDDRWDIAGTPGATATPIRDIFDLKKDFVDQTGAQPTGAIINSELLTILMFNQQFQTLLAKSNFGDGDLFSRPAEVIGNLLGVGTLTVYDEIHEVSEWLAGNAAAGQADITLESVTDFEVGADMRIYDMTTPFDFEEHTITAVNVATNTITVDNVLASGYVSGRDRVVQRRKFIDDNRFFMYARQIDGEDIAEFMEAPFGLERTWGMYVDTKEEWDPDGLWIRVQNKGLPVIYHPDALFSLIVS